MAYLLQPTATLIRSSVHVLSALTVRIFPWVGFIIRSYKSPNPKFVHPHKVEIMSNQTKEGAFKYCWCYALLEFLAHSGAASYLSHMLSLPAQEQQFVPMFPFYDADTGLFDFRRTVEASWVKAMLKKVFSHPSVQPYLCPNGVRATPHSLRAVGFIWALRSGLEWSIAKQCARVLGLNDKHASKCATLPLRSTARAPRQRSLWRARAVRRASAPC